MFPYTIERGVRFRRPIELIGFRRHVMETGAAAAVDHDMAARPRRYGNPTSSAVSPRSRRSASRSAGERVDRRDLAPEPGRETRSTSATCGCWRRSPEPGRGPRERPPGRRDPPAERHGAELAIINGIQQGLAAELDMQAMYDLVGDEIQEIFDAQVVDIGVSTATRAGPVPVHDRARCPVPR